MPELSRTTTVEKRKRLMVLLAEARRLTQEVAREEERCQHLFLDEHSPRVCVSCGKVE